MPVNLVTISAERAFEVIAINKTGAKVDKLSLDDSQREKEMKAFGDIIGQDAINRFDKKKKKKKPGHENQRPKQGNRDKGDQRPNGPQNNRPNRKPNNNPNNPNKGKNDKRPNQQGENRPQENAGNNE